MIRLSDATILAYTKFRSHRIRTTITVVIAGILFGFLVLANILAQGVLDSADKFNKEGLGFRYLVNITQLPEPGFDAWSNVENPDFIKRVEARHAEIVAKKTAAAKKYNIEYNAALEDQSPITLDAITKKKSISDQMVNSEIVLDMAAEITNEQHKPFDINTYLQPYSSTRILGSMNQFMPRDGTIVYMVNGKEKQVTDERVTRYIGEDEREKALAIIPQSVATPFVTSKTFDPSKGEVPVVIPYADAEKLLKLKPLGKTTSNEEKVERVREVRGRVGEISASFCYRNTASQALLTKAIAQRDEIAANKSNAQYQKPALIYNIPSESECGAVTVASDVRTSAEKLIDENRIAYEKEIGSYLGEPMERKIAFRGVGTSADITTQTSTIADMIQGLLGSSLGYNTWNIPKGLFNQLPESARPASIFSQQLGDDAFFGESYLVEFGDKQQARELLQKTGYFGGSMDNTITTYQFGSSSLTVDEMRGWFESILLWVIIIIGGIAVIIMSGIIGRTIADGRKESAVFRAIGAKRIDILSIYTLYTLLLSLRVVLFAFFMGIFIALIIDFVVYKDATLGAQLAFNIFDESQQFHVVSFTSWYLPVIAGVIMLAGLIAAIIPLLRNIRRNPIKDMRDE